MAVVVNDDDDKTTVVVDGCVRWLWLGMKSGKLIYNVEIRGIIVYSLLGPSHPLFIVPKITIQI